MKWNNTLGAVLAKLEISAAELVSRCDAIEPGTISPTLASYYVRGRSVPSVTNAYVIARALGMPIEQVFWRACEVTGPREAAVAQAIAQENATNETRELLRSARKQLAPFARKHPRGEDGLRDVSALLERLDGAIRQNCVVPEKLRPAQVI